MADQKVIMLREASVALCGELLAAEAARGLLLVERSATARILTT
jgi:hypothetical protein